MTTETTIVGPARRGHTHCLICGQPNPWSLGLQFHADEAGRVGAEFQAHPKLQGYDGILHGGVIASLLDAAMTHCLFHRNVRAVTGERRACDVPVASWPGQRRSSCSTRSMIHRQRRMAETVG